MSEGKWTRGPWRVEKGTTLVWSVRNPDDQSAWGMGYPVAEAVHARDWHREGRPTDRERVANAALIAAAPDLYEALKDLLHCQEQLSGHADDDLDVIAARAALARARGESPGESR